jgi:hypothetical protein
MWYLREEVPVRGDHDYQFAKESGKGDNASLWPKFIQAPSSSHA